jgi:site-specific recombinase XerD
MHAVVVNVKVNDPEVADKGLRERVIPMVKQAPGLVSAYWIQLGDDTGASIVVFETEEQARVSAPQPGPGEGVTFTNVEIGEVIANL